MILEPMEKYYVNLPRYIGQEIIKPIYIHNGRSREGVSAGGKWWKLSLLGH